MAWGMRNIVISILGSSIMEGRIGVVDPMQRWYNLLLAQLSRAHPEICFSIVNGAVGGESTREVMDRLDRDVLPYHPDFCLFMAGANNHDCRNPQRILGEGEFARLLETFAARLLEKTQVVGVVLNPIVDEWHFATTHPDYVEHLATFGGSLDASNQPEREAARAFYRQQGWPVVDLYEGMSGDPRRYVLPEDGIHLNGTGHELFAREMFEIMNEGDSLRTAKDAVAGPFGGT